MLDKIEGGKRRGREGDEMVGWHHRLNGHGFGWTPADGDGQGGLACCDSWGRKEYIAASSVNRAMTSTLYQAGQKICLGFSITCYRKTQMNCLANPSIY